MWHGSCASCLAIIVAARFSTSLFKPGTTDRLMRKLLKNQGSCSLQGAAPLREGPECRLLSSERASAMAPALAKRRATDVTNGRNGAAPCLRRPSQRRLDLTRDRPGSSRRPSRRPRHPQLPHPIGAATYRVCRYVQLGQPASRTMYCSACTDSGPPRSCGVVAFGDHRPHDTMQRVACRAAPRS